MQRCFSFYLVALTCCTCAAGAEPAPISKLEVFPPQIELRTAADRQSFVVQATRSDGTTVDVTSEAKLSFADQGRAVLDAGRLAPAGDGQTKLIAEYARQRAETAVTVVDATVDRPISFKLDVMPVFMRSGCNSGRCHGSARGKDGFRLSLFGFDPDGDYYRLTREISGRRLNLSVPEECLLINKAIGNVTHSGGQRFEPESELYRTLVNWLEAGAPQDLSAVPTPVALEIFPRRILLSGAGATQQMTVRARYNDGSDRDVTQLALYLTNNDSVTQVSENGRITAGRRGESFVMARFATFTEGTEVIVFPETLEGEFRKLAEHNYIDTLVNQKLEKLRVEPSELASDEVFLRRAYIDIIGLLPTPADFDRFMKDGDPKKRERLVDELLARDEFYDLWVMKWAELLQIRSVNGISSKALLGYFIWLKEKVSSGTPMNVVAQEVLSATGSSFKNPATNYYQIETNNLLIGENVAQVFMGMRIQCAQCHNHPFDRWTMNDYYGFNAFFTQIGFKQAADPREVIIYNSARGEVRHPVDNRPMLPKFLGGDVPNVEGQDYRAVLAKWIASPENPYFARNLANIVWGHFFGIGIIEPVDDVRISNPPSNAELLDAIAQKFTQSNYDLRSLVREICTSVAYQRSTQKTASNELDERNFSRAAIRRIRAEVLFDCISQVTETKHPFPGMPAGSRAVQIVDGSASNYFLTTFGRATRDTVCSCEVKAEPNLSQALHLLNGDTILTKITEGGVIARQLAEKRPPQEIISDLYVRCLSRGPTADEMAGLEKLLAAEGDQQKLLEDMFWALLSSKEFVFNH